MICVPVCPMCPECVRVPARPPVFLNPPMENPINMVETGVWESPRVVDGGVTATGVLSRERGNLVTVSSTL